MQISSTWASRAVAILESGVYMITEIWFFRQKHSGLAIERPALGNALGNENWGRGQKYQLFL